MLEWAKRNELSSIDYSRYSGSGLMTHRVSPPAGGGSRRWVAAHTIRRVVGALLRTVVIFALVHRPMFSLSRVALEALVVENLRSGHRLPRRELREFARGAL